MESIVLHSRDERLLERVDRLVPAELRERMTVQAVGGPVELGDFLRYQIPDLVVLVLDPAVDDFTPMFRALTEDPWTSSIGFILVSPDIDRATEIYKGFNIAYFLELDGLEKKLGRVLAILSQGLSTLTSAGLIKKLTALSGELVLPTDIFLVQFYAAFFSNYLYQEGYLSQGKKLTVHLALSELILNAMEHGNAGIGFAEKAEWLGTNASIQELVERRMSMAPYRDRVVRFHYHISPPRSTFQITDEGEGFDTSKVKAGLLDAHGRGILLSISCTDKLIYNTKGNSVTIEVEHDGPAETHIPSGFVEAEPRVFSPGDVVFSENEPSDLLFYIVSGEYDIHVKGKKVASAGPADVFLGETSFLLANRRTATVVARAPGKLAEISREAFREAVKRHPSYGILLAKLLARRLQRAQHELGADVTDAT